MITFPFLVQAMRNGTMRSYAWMIAFVSCMSLLPLLPRSQETVLKWSIAATGAILDWILLRPAGVSEALIIGVVGVAVMPEVFRVFIHGVLMKDSKYEFLPLMVTSVVHAVLLCGVLVVSFRDAFRVSEKVKK